MKNFKELYNSDKPEKSKSDKNSRTSMNNKNLGIKELEVF